MSITSEFTSLFAPQMHDHRRHISYVKATQSRFGGVIDPEVTVLASNEHLTKSQLADITRLEKRKFSTKEATCNFARGLRNAGYTFESTSRNHATTLHSTNPVPLQVS